MPESEELFHRTLTFELIDARIRGSDRAAPSLAD
jgi:hypothetical protein